MKHSILKTIKMLLIAVLLSNFISSVAQKPDYAGVWGIWGGENYSPSQYPWYKGTVINSEWNKIQPAKSRFDFADLDRKVNKAVQNELFMILKIYIAPGLVPEWLFTEVGVERVQAPKPYWALNGDHPWYFDPKFKPEFSRMINAFADHIDTYPLAVRQKIIGVQAVIAKSGDPQPYSGTPFDPKYYIPKENPNRWWADTGWRDYSREMFKEYYDAFSNKSPEIKVLVKPMENNAEWVLTNLPNAGRKTSMPGQGYHTSREMMFSHEYKKGIRMVREEFDAAVQQNTSWYNAAPVWNLYWTGLFSLNCGLDIWNHRTLIMDNPNPHLIAMNFFTKWAGDINPSVSQGGWIAFRDDIDCADTVRFPQSVYGRYTIPYTTAGPNYDRFNAIAMEFEPYGAKQDDPLALKLEILNVIHQQKGMNDVQWDVWRGNYSMHISQINPLITSQGYWRVGPKDQPYGRFARGFNSSANKNAIYLDLDNRMFLADSISYNPSVTVNIVYFDQGTGSWELRYDAKDNPDKQAVMVTKTNSGRWKTATINLSDVHFNNRGPQGSDLSLINPDQENDIFHMVEVIKNEKTAIQPSTDMEKNNLNCFPNPFNPGSEEVNFHFQSSAGSSSLFRIYDVQGNLVLLKNLHYNTNFTWNGRNNHGTTVKDGLYLGLINSGTDTYSFKLVIKS